MPHPLTSLADLGTFVRALRLARRLTQAELADRLGLGRRLVSELESGTRDLKTSNLLHTLGRLGFDLHLAARHAGDEARVTPAELEGAERERRVRMVLRPAPPRKKPEKRRRRA